MRNNLSYGADFYFVVVLFIIFLRALNTQFNIIDFLFACSLHASLGTHKNDVAFTAVTSSATNYRSSRTIAFNKMLLNHGNAFSTSNYRFTAPSEGLYVFSWSLALVKGSYNGNVNLVKDGSVYHSTQCSNTYQQCGNTAAVWLGKNNRVWIQTRSNNVYVYGTFSSFSGWKVHW